MMKYPVQITIPPNTDLYESRINISRCGTFDAVSRAETENTIILNENEFLIQEFGGVKYAFFGYFVRLSDCSYTEKEYPDDTIFNLKLEVPKGTECLVSKYVYSGFTGYYNVNKIKTTKK